MQKIDSFRGEHRFLSNFFFCDRWVLHAEVLYPTAEHAYQAAKEESRSWRMHIANLRTPGEAKRAGRRVVLRKGWEERKLEMMLDVVRSKFERNPALAQMLIDTGEAELVEGNTWGDRFWGTYQGTGRNELGKVLMQVRKELKDKEKT